MIKASWEHIQWLAIPKCDPTQKKHIHLAVLASLQRIMYEESQGELLQSLDRLRIENAHFPQFRDYIERRWVIDGRLESWTASNEPQIHTSMDNNNFVER